MKDDVDYESPGSGGGAARAGFSGENENDDPLCRLVHPVPVQHYFHHNICTPHMRYLVHPSDGVEPALGRALEVVVLHPVKDDERLIALRSMTSMTICKC